MPKGMYPDTVVYGVAIIKIAVQTLENSPMATILVVQDNLVKGAAGQAVQNMNVMFGLAEQTGLALVAVVTLRSFFNKWF